MKKSKKLLLLVAFIISLISVGTCAYLVYESSRDDELSSQAETETRNTEKEEDSTNTLDTLLPVSEEILLLEPYIHKVEIIEGPNVDFSSFGEVEVREDYLNFKRNCPDERISICEGAAIFLTNNKLRVSDTSIDNAIPGTWLLNVFVVYLKDMESYIYEDFYNNCAQQAITAIIRNDETAILVGIPTPTGSESGDAPVLGVPGINQFAEAISKRLELPEIVYCGG